MNSGAPVCMIAKTIIPLLLVCTQAGCSENKTSGDWAVTGRVIDSLGRPVSAARVGIDYSASSQRTMASTIYQQTRVRPSESERDSTCIAIWNLCGEPVTSIRCGAGLCGWDGHNDSGQIVPLGLYRVRSGSCDSSNASAEFLILVKPKSLSDMIGPNLSPLAITDAQGRFAIRSCVMATGIPIACENDYGIQDTCFVSDSITVFAWADSSWGEVPAHHSVKRTTDVQIRLQTPISKSPSFRSLEDVLSPTEF